MVVDLEKGRMKGEGEDRSGEGAALGGAGVGGVSVYCVEVVSPEGGGRTRVPSVSDGAESRTYGG